MKEYSVVLVFGDENAFDCFIVESSKIEFSNVLMDEGCGSLYDGMKLILKIDGKEIDYWAVVIKTFESEEIKNIKLNNVLWEEHVKKNKGSHWKDVIKFKSIGEELERCKKVLGE